MAQGPMRSKTALSGPQETGQAFKTQPQKDSRVVRPKGKGWPTQ